MLIAVARVSFPAIKLILEKFVILTSGFDSVAVLCFCSASIDDFSAAALLFPNQDMPLSDVFSRPGVEITFNCDLSTMFKALDVSRAAEEVEASTEAMKWSRNVRCACNRSSTRRSYRF